MIVNSSNNILETYIDLKKSFKVRSSRNFTEIVTSTNDKIYHNKSKKFTQGLYLFRMVKKDVLNFIDEYGEVEPYEELPVNFSNLDYNFDKSVIGLDINNAYWSVAFLKGYISENTYKKGIEKEGLKAIRLSSLSCLGRKRMYEVYEKGVHTHDEAIRGDLRLQNIYLDIRYSTYGVMLEIAKELNEDFCCWKTDCIFFHDTDENVEKAENIIESYGLECKIEKKDISKLKPKKREV